MTDNGKILTHLDDMRLFADTRVHQIVSPENWEVYSDLCDRIDLVKEEILALLKEQEPKQVKTDMYGNAYCPWCSTDGTIEMGVQRLHLGTQFCPYCGKAVKWE